MSSQEKDQTQNYLSGTSLALVIIIILGLASIVAYSFQADGLMKKLPIISNGFMFAGACFLMGGFIGFLFGIPRTLQHDHQEQNNSDPVKQPSDKPSIKYQANTNLEQISDWLTKILVGVGLTQMTSIYQKILKLTAYMEKGLGSFPSSQSFALSIFMFFIVCGFLCGYLWSRLILAALLINVDRAALGLIQKKFEQSEIDANALNLVYRQLDRSLGVPEVSGKELTEAIKSASEPVKIQIYYKAQALRAANWKEDRTKPMMERTIPVFRALAEDDQDEKFHQNYAQLGYTLKDKIPPSWKEAELALSKAIDIRNRQKASGWLFYEYNRAICRIRMDDAFKNKEPSTTESKNRILPDLKAAYHMEDADRFFNQEPIDDWLKLNKISRQELLADE